MLPSDDRWLFVFGILVFVCWSERRERRAKSPRLKPERGVEFCPANPGLAGEVMLGKIQPGRNNELEVLQITYNDILERDVLLGQLLSPIFAPKK